MRGWGGTILQFRRDERASPEDVVAAASQFAVADWPRAFERHVLGDRDRADAVRELRAPPVKLPGRGPLRRPRHVAGWRSALLEYGRTRYDGWSDWVRPTEPGDPRPINADDVGPRFNFEV